MRSVRWAVLTAAGLVASLGVASAQSVLSPSQDPLAGSRVFGSKGCVKCHSVNGVGGKVAPDLARTMRPRSFVDLATAMWNHLPNMTDRMKQLGIARPQLDSREAGDLVGFLYTLNYFDPPGNADAGKRLFSEKRCIVCHTVRGAGGVVGPNLDHLQQFRSPIFVASAMWNHGPQMAEKMKERGIERPTFTAKELQDLIAYLAPATGGPEEGPLYVLPGRATPVGSSSRRSAASSATRSEAWGAGWGRIWSSAGCGRARPNSRRRSGTRRPPWPRPCNHGDRLAPARPPSRWRTSSPTSIRSATSRAATCSRDMGWRAKRGA